MRFCRSLARPVVLGLLLAADLGCAHNALGVNGLDAADLEILQGGRRAALSADGATVRLRREEVELRSRSPRIDVCLSRSAADLTAVVAGTNTGTDPRSCLFVAKSFAMDSDSDYLILDGDGSSSLNREHGLRRLPDGTHAFTLRKIFDNATKTDIPIKDAVGPLYAAIWIDKNDNRVVDVGEYRQLTIVFE